jgi:hypothetical protein
LPQQKSVIMERLYWLIRMALTAWLKPQITRMNQWPFQLDEIRKVAFMLVKLAERRHVSKQLISKHFVSNEVDRLSLCYVQLLLCDHNHPYGVCYEHHMVTVYKCCMFQHTNVIHLFVLFHDKHIFMLPPYCNLWIRG